MAFITFTPLLTRARTQVQTTSRTRRYAVSPTKMVDSNTIVVAASAVLGTMGGVALLAFTEQQGARSDARVRTEVCVVCKGDRVIVCSVCKGTGRDVLNEELPCKFCDAEKYITCYNCKGSGIQPRFLDRYVQNYTVFQLC